MVIEDIFSEEGANRIIDRINKLTPETKAQWGKMSVDQMLAHCNVPYQMVFVQGKYKKPTGIKKVLVKLFAKNAVVGPKPYPKNGRTAPDFIITESKNFEVEKNKLISYIMKVKKLGKQHFDNKESHSFGRLSIQEWNTLFSKHIDHHLTQFNA